MSGVLRARWIDETSFGPFGGVVRAREDVAPRSANHGHADAWDPFVRVWNERGDKAALVASLFRCKARMGDSIALTTLERHPRSSQLFVPMWSGERRPLYLVVVAQGREAPDLATLRAFVAEGAVAITYLPGIWHHPMIALDAPIDFVNLVSPGDAGVNCDEVDVVAHGLAVHVGALRATIGAAAEAKIRFDLAEARVIEKTNAGAVIYELRELEERLARTLLGLGPGELAPQLRSRARSIEPAILREAEGALARAEEQQWGIGTFASAAAEGLASMSEVYRLKLARAWLFLALGDRATAEEQISAVERDPNQLHRDFESELRALRSS